MTTFTAPADQAAALIALKAQHHATWADGNYAAVAEQIAVALPQAALDGLDLAGRDVLDVATGTGNAAILAAQRGARVTGQDLVDDLLEVARDRSADLGLDIRWDEGDVELLPYADAAFDVVTSTVGVQFAPRAAAVASELKRVTRRGGRIVLVNWTKEGLIGQMFGVLGRYLPAPPSWVTTPPTWGTEAYLRGLFAADEVTITRGVNPFVFPSAGAFLEFFTTEYGPTKRAMERTQGEGRWDDLRADLIDLFTRLNSASDGTLRIDSEFLVCTVQPRA